MTNKNIQLTIMFALIAMVGIPLYAMANTTEVGVTTIKLQKQEHIKNPILQQLNELESMKQLADNGVDPCF